MKIQHQQPQPRSAEIIKEQLADLAEVQGSVNTEIPIDFATQLSIDSLALHEADLREELKAAEWLTTKGDVEFVLEGSLVVNHAVQAELLSKFLDQIQKLRFAVAETARRNFSSRWHYTDNLVADSRLMVESFVPSSFAIRLTYAKPLTPALLLETILPDENLFAALFSGETEFDELKDIAKSPRLHRFYLDFLDFVAKYDLTVGTRTKKYPFLAEMSPQNARDRARLLNYTQSPAEEEEIEIEGILVMGDIKNKSFLITAEASIYRGQVSESGAAGLRQVALGNRVRAHLKVTIPREDSGRLGYTLITLEVAPDCV
jgi:hypothetical protein